MIAPEGEPITEGLTGVTPFAAFIKRAAMPGIGALAVLGAPAYASGDCNMWTDSTRGYSVCLPEGWYSRSLPSGALALCDDKNGGCTRAVEGGPLSGHATIFLVPASVALTRVTPRGVDPKPPQTIEEFAHWIADRDPSSLFSEAVDPDVQFRGRSIKNVPRHGIENHHKLAGESVMRRYALMGVSEFVLHLQSKPGFRISSVGLRQPYGHFG